MMRYNPTELIGVNAVERIFLTEFNWIFRSQHIVDVGIDALVEQVDNGEPKGKFVALQIKSGKRNFLISDKKLTYYVSNIHYNYWLNFDMPVLLIAHLPDKGKTYWAEIKEEHITKTKKKWKIEIPFQNVLNSNSKERIINILSHSNVQYKSIKIFTGENIDEETVFDIIEKVECITDSTESTKRSVKILEEFTEKINEFNARLTEFNQKGQGLNSGQVKAAINNYAKNMNLCSKRLENECSIFSETFAAGFYAFEQVIRIQLSLKNNNEDLDSALSSISGMSSAIDKSIDGITVLKNALTKLPNDFNALKEAKNNMLDVIVLKIDEYKVAKDIVCGIVESAQEAKQLHQLTKATGNGGYLFTK